MIWSFLILSQLHVIYTFPTDTARNVEIVASSFPDLELIEPPVDLSSDLEKGNEKTHKIADSYRAKELDVTGNSNVSDQFRQTVITIDHVSPDQRPPYGRPPMPPTEVEVFQRPNTPAEYPGRPIPFPPVRPAQYPPFRPGSLPPHRPGLNRPNVPLPPDVEMFNPPGSLSPNVPLPPDVDVFNPSDVRPISFPTNVADIEVVPFDKKAIKSQVGVNDSSMKPNFYSTLDIPEESQTSNSGYLNWNATKVHDDYDRILRFLDQEESPADEVLRSSTKSSSSEQKNVQPSKESHDFVVKIYHNPPKMCYNKINDEEPEKCITFSTNTTSANVTEGKGSDDVENVSPPKTGAIEKEASNEVNSAEVPFHSTQEISTNIKFDTAADLSPVDDNLEIKKLIDQLLVENVHSKGVDDKEDKPDTTEFSIAQEMTTEKTLLVKEIVEVKNVSIEDSSVKSDNATESNKILNSTSSQISAQDAIIPKDPIPTSISEQKMSPEQYKALCQLLAEYFVKKMQISSASSEIVSSNEDFNEYAISPILPSTYEEPLIVSGRSADDNDDLVSLLDSVDFVLPESSINSFERSAQLDGAVNEANSELYLVSQQSQNMRSAESYLSPSEEIIVPYEFEGYV